MALLLLCGLCAASELSILARDRLRSRGKRVDRGSRSIVIWLLLIGLAVAAATHVIGCGSMLGDPVPWFWAGSALAVFGIYVRQRAVAHLGRFFRTEVTLLDDHRLVTDGPYARVRHPAYTGFVLMLIGIGLAFACVIAIIAMIAPVIGLIYRIRVEEAALESRFGAEWAEYRARTGALLPSWS